MLPWKKHNGCYCDSSGSDTESDFFYIQCVLNYLWKASETITAVTCEESMDEKKKMRIYTSVHAEAHFTRGPSAK